MITLFALPALALVFDQAAPKVRTVDQVIANIQAWDGRTVFVRGWVHGCHGGLFYCQLEAEPAPHRPRRTAILDYVKAVEPRLGALDGSEIVLRARVTSECSGENICTDRGPQLIPIRIERVLVRRKLPARKEN